MGNTETSQNKNTQSGVNLSNSKDYRKDFIESINRRKTMNIHMRNKSTTNDHNNNNDINNISIFPGKNDTNDTSIYEVNLDVNLNTINSTRKNSIDNQDDINKDFCNSRKQTFIGEKEMFNNEQLYSNSNQRTDRNNSVGRSENQSYSTMVTNQNLDNLTQPTASLWNSLSPEYENTGLSRDSSLTLINEKLKSSMTFDQIYSGLNSNFRRPSVKHQSASSVDPAILRARYISELIKKGLFGRKKINYNFNNIFILEWDDTLLPTTYITDCLRTNKTLDESHKLFLAKIEFNVLRILTFALKSNSDIYIISGADREWISSSARKYLKGVYKLLKANPSIKQVYSKDYYIDTNNEEAPEFNVKEKAVLDILSSYSKEKLTNIMTISNSISILDSVVTYAKDLTNCYYKNLKLMDWPSIEQLNKQLELLADQLSTVYSSVRNINIKVRIGGKK